MKYRFVLHSALFVLSLELMKALLILMLIEVGVS